MQQEIEETESEDTILTLTETITVPSGKKIDYNGHTLTQP